MDDYTPSHRQLEDWDMSEEEARREGLLCDSHYETVRSFEIASAICQALKDYFQWNATRSDVSSA